MLDTRMKELAASGKRIHRHQAEIINIDEEEQIIIAPTRHCVIHVYDGMHFGLSDLHKDAF